ncbi:MAG TPA: hypothetical protein VFK86_18565 [Bauldia sp.]|nr:hypothetical protein [Bauldia sp.]
MTQTLLALFTAALVLVGALQFCTLKSQTAVQRGTAQANLAPTFSKENENERYIVSFTNTGTTPARDVRIYKVSGPPGNLSLDSFCSKASEETTALTVHPGASIETHFPMTTPDEEGQPFTMCGWVNYRDVFDESHRSMFCFSLTAREATSEHDYSICPSAEQDY